ncbi:MAG: hypothetical protein D3921_13755 [Candidatus Electrothrix sp. AW1]|nr:hypothetical protein [Candidatus Electrothrix sp. AX1]MCI5183558.1 hypothetical protein [Candidatus Electrothrix gigas]
MIVKGRGVKKRMLTAAIIVRISSLPNTATACGMCGFGILEYTLPHTMFWCLGITIWFCAVGIITAPKKFVTDLIAVFVIFFLGTAFFGPYPFGLLALTACTRTISGFLPNIRKKMSEKSKRSLSAVTAMALVGIAVGLAISVHTLNTRSDVDFILRWGGYQGRAVLHNLIAEPQKNEVQLKQFLSNIDRSDIVHLYFAEKVSKALATMEKERAAADTKADLPEEQ